MLQQELRPAVISIEELEHIHQKARVALSIAQRAQSLLKMDESLLLRSCDGDMPDRGKIHASRKEFQAAQQDAQDAFAVATSVGAALDRSDSHKKTKDFQVKDGDLEFA